MPEGLFKTAQRDEIMKRDRELLEIYTFTDLFDLIPKVNASIGNNANQYWELVSGSDSQVAYAPGGGFRLTTTGTKNNQQIIGGHADTDQGPVANLNWNTNDEIAMSVRLTTGGSVSNVKIHGGFKLTNTDMSETTDDDQVFFSYDTGNSDSNWKLNYSIGGTDTERDTGKAVSADTDYLLQVYVDSNRVPRLYVDGDLAASGFQAQGVVGGSSADTLTSDKDLVPMLGIETLEASGKHMEVRGVVLRKLYND